jgi:dTDP-4-dehydrorhamnose reductase
MKVLLTGAAGQLGQALRQQVPAGVELIATSRSGDPATGLVPLDLADADACRAAVLSHRPDWVLNCGTYTAVERAESEQVLALAVNGGAPRAFAEALLESGGRLLQVSTDFVFNGQQRSPYRPGPRRGGRPGGLPHQHRHPGCDLLAGDHRQRAGAGAALV